MAIKPVTFQGQSNFDAHLYALEVKSRFIDQNNAHGYYTNYGDELDAQVVGGNQIQVKTGAFVVCARMAEITAPEILRPQMFNGFKGYVVARIETYHPADEFNVTLVAKIQTTWDALNGELEQNDVYAADADNINTAYELPIYSFEISGTQIVNLTKLIKPVCDYATMKTIVDNALATAKNAVTTANKAATDAASAVATSNAANTKSDNAVSTANAANTKSDNAVSTANAANSKSDAAVATANKAATDAASAVATSNAADDKSDAALDASASAVHTAAVAKSVAHSAKTTAENAEAVALIANTAAQTAVTTAENAEAVANGLDAQIKSANDTAANAVASAEAANDTAAEAVASAEAANDTAANALEIANGLDAQIKAANDTAASVVDTANDAKTTAEQATADVAELAEQIAEGQGTAVTLNGVPQATYPADDLVHEGDKVTEATEADASNIALYAAQAAEAEKAVGYVRGGEIDKALKNIFARLTALEGGN